MKQRTSLATAEAAVSPAEPAAARRAEKVAPPRKRAAGQAARSRGRTGRNAVAHGAAGAVPPEGAALSTTDKLVQAATELFATQGYIYSTLDDVASLAGFSKGAVYYYFKEKEELLLEVLRRIEARSIDTTAAAVKQHGGTGRERLQVFVKFQTRWAAQHPKDLAVLMLMSAETANTSARVRAQVVKIYRKLGNLLVDIIEHGKHTREFLTTQETSDVVLYLQAVHDGNMMIWYRSGTDPEIGRRLARVTLTGFLKTVME